MKASQLLKDPEASGLVFSSTRRFTVSTTATGIKAVTVMIQPGTVEGVRIFEAHNITVLHRATITSIPWEDLESDAVVGEPVVPCQFAVCPKEKNIHHFKNISWYWCFTVLRLSKFDISCAVGTDKKTMSFLAYLIRETGIHLPIKIQLNSFKKRLQTSSWGNKYFNLMRNRLSSAGKLILLWESSIDNRLFFIVKASLFLIRVLTADWNRYWIQHLRNHATSLAERCATIQPVTGTMLFGTNRHCITTVDWLSVHLSHGMDVEIHLAVAASPCCWSHNSTIASAIIAVTCTTVHPVFGVVARRVGGPQGNQVTAVDEGKSATLHKR